MRKKNGTTIVEILISIIIIAIVMAVLFTMLVQVRNEDQSNQIQSNFVINQSTMIKEVEEDIVNYGVKKVSGCTLSEANISNTVLNHTYATQFKCVKLEYAADYIEDNIGFIMLYNTYARYDVENGEFKGKSDTARWMIQYVRGRYDRFSGGLPMLSSWHNATQVMKDYPADVIADDGAYVSYTANSSAWNAASLVIPILSGEGEHYDINLSFTFKGNNTFKCSENNVSNFKCTCNGEDPLCAPTYN